MLALKTWPGVEWRYGKLRRTTLLVVFCAAALVGVAVSRKVSFGLGLAALTVVFFCLATMFHGRLLLVGAIVLGLGLGGWRGSVYMQQLARYGPYYDQKVILVGTAVDDAGYGKQSQLAFDLQNARVNGIGKPLVGRIGVSGFGANVILRGDYVQVEGKLRAGKGARQGYMSFAELADKPAELGLIDTFRRKFAAGMQSALPEPEASFAMGLLVGQKSNLPDSVYTDLTQVGLVHIIAVSGYNLTIILRASLKLLGKRSKYQTFVVAVSLIIVFLLITGASASIVRASIVSGLSMLAWYYGRAFRAIILIGLAAAITALANPLYLWGDIGWYLSFLAFFGVLILSPLIRERFLTDSMKRSAIVGILLESLSAEIMTLPLVLYIFGQMSAVSLLANVVVAAFVPAAMLLSLIAGLTGMLATALAGWVAWPATLILTYMLDAAHILAHVPHNFHQNIYLTAVGMILVYCLVVLFILVLHSRLRRNSAIIKLLKDDNPLLRSSFAAPSAAVHDSS